MAELCSGAFGLTPIQPMCISDVSCAPWLAVYVKPRHEKNVAVTFECKGYEAFLPTYMKHHRYNRKFELPLFPGYVFCRSELSKTLPLMTTPGVFSIVGNGRQLISEEEINAVRRVATLGLTPSPWPYISPGQELCIQSGPLRGVRGVLVDASDQRWLVVSIHLLQRSVAAKVDRETQ
jgi:transcription termination/antitermination protein NusG